MPLDDGEADVAVSGLVLNFIPDKEATPREIRRVVKPDGIAAAYVWDYAGEMQFIRHFWNAVGELFPEAANKDEGTQFPICNPGALSDLFRATGLTSVEICALEAPTVFANFDDYWSPFLLGHGPAGANASRCPAMTGAACETISKPRYRQTATAPFL